MGRTMPFRYVFDFDKGPGPWKTWMAPSLQNEPGGLYEYYTRYHLAGDLDPNHIDDIGPIWLLAHLSIPAFGSPGQLDLNDATIKLTIRAQDLEANGSQLAFWVIRYLPEEGVYKNYYVGLQSTNWAYTGANIIDDLGTEWATISVNIDDDMANWTYAGNYTTDQGDWADRYVDYPIGDTVTHVDATLHLVFIGDDADNPPTGFVDIASIEIITQTEAIPLRNYDYEMVIYATEDEPFTGTLSVPDGVDASTASFEVVSGSVKNGTLVIDSATGAFTFTPDPDFWGPERSGFTAEFEYKVTDASSTSDALGAYVYVAPINDAPETFTGNENITIEYEQAIDYSLRLGTDVDAGDSMTFEVDPTSVVGGTLTLDEETGRYTFTAANGFSGTGGFNYRVTDGLAESAWKSVEIEVLADGQGYDLPSFGEVVNDFLIPGDYQSFVYWTIRLAEAGDNNASYHYGTWLNAGLNVNQSSADGVPFLTAAIGFADDASLQLATLYTAGTGVPRDYAQARQLLEDLGDNASALYQLGVLADLGFGFVQDSQLAVSYYYQASVLGNADAMYTLGRRLLTGDGTDATRPSDAYFYLGIGLKFGGGPNIEVFRDLLRFNMDLAAEDLTAQEISDLDAAIASWSIGDALPNSFVDLSSAGGTFTGSAAADIITGSDFDDIVTGLGGADTLDGAGGIDTADYSAAPGGVFVNLSAGSAKNDGYGSSDSLSNFENVSGSAYDDVIAGNDLDNVLVGGLGFDVLIGYAGNDTLSGGSGAANQMIGGLGDDTYIVAASGDSIVEYGGEGVDTVRTGLSTFFLPQHVETLVFTGSGSFRGIGNSGNNTIIGGAGDDVLQGLEGDDVLIGGAGNDVLLGDGGSNQMIGGTGDDLYYVSSTGDSLFEGVDAGYDKVFASVASYTLRDNFEYLRYTGSGDFTGTGNDLGNIIVGGTGNDVLDGKGGADVIIAGAGNDTLIGGDGDANQLIGEVGDDIYVVTANGDSVVEYFGEGTDAVRTTLSQYTLSNHVENLEYIGTASFTGVGNALDNVLRGGAQSDFLSGKDGADTFYGGSGDDTLLGGAGVDRFRYETTDQGIDRILDFTSGEDIIELSAALFGSPELVFENGTAATSSSATFLYDPATGLVRYDADGDGSGDAVTLFRLNAGLTLTADDFGFY